MNPSPIYHDEKARLEALRECAVLDTPPEEVFDEVTSFAADICRTPIALITLVDKDRQWFKSALGIGGREMPRQVSFCANAIKQPDLFVVPDTALDRQFAENPIVVGEPKVRFYAGAPLVTPDGLALGTVCVMDREPRTLKAMQRRALRMLSRHVMALLQLRRKDRRATVARFGVGEESAPYREAQAGALRDSESRFNAFMRKSPAVAWMKDGEGRYVYVNETLTTFYQTPADQVLGRTDGELLPAPAARQLRENDQRVLSSGQPVQFTEHIPAPGGEVRSWRVWKFPFKDLAGKQHVGDWPLTSPNGCRRRKRFTSRRSGIAVWWRKRGMRFLLCPPMRSSPP